MSRSRRTTPHIAENSLVDDATDVCSLLYIFATFLVKSSASLARPYFYLIQSNGWKSLCLLTGLSVQDHSKLLLQSKLVLVDCLVAPATCGAMADCLCILVASLLSCSRLTIASPLSRRRLPVTSPPLSPAIVIIEDSDGDGDRHRHCRSLSLPVLLPPPTPFFPPPSPLLPLTLSGCVRRAGRFGGTATPAVIRDGTNGRTTKTRYTTASAAADATEEEECIGCNGADPQRRLDDSLLRLADGILLRSIVATMVPRRGGGGVWRPRRC
jgi:hypothetical protein